MAAKQMKKSTVKRNFKYPEITPGSKLAKGIRSEANKLSEKERENLFKRGMQVIYGGSGAGEAVRSR